jgi:uncharacterized coiled-coil DUF342 family protein
MRPASYIAIALVAVVVGCGESKSDKAMADVCAARDDISKQVDQLKNMTVSTATKSQVTDSLQAIRNDLSKIADARPALSEDRRQQVDAANTKFQSSVRATLLDVGKTVSLQDASAQIKNAFDRLAASYKEAFSGVDCS